MSEALTTLGWTIRVSHTLASGRATGPASPACPPIVALIPVGTTKTTWNASVFSNGRWRYSKIDGIGFGSGTTGHPPESGGAERMPTSQWHVRRAASVEQTTN